ncbi:very short patch repair endonuclease [uncultured Bacteroides sp.]|uniref:very short patch repair endonuclease n=1 Tax=uncultured Bacteroides sp. TaxID=162156 RepID=UPI0025AA27EF|nr:very short patch repair endonuclease [uncultured Bacteroides sp.]
MDIWDKKKRSAVMAKIKGRDTKPEWIVRCYLFSRGYRYRKNVKGLPGTPDIVLRKYGIVIFIHGCFWHGHEVDGTMPKTNREFWKKKIEQNKQRDAKNKEALRKMGWSVMTVWECQLKPAVRQQTLLEIEYHINHLYLERFKPKTPRFYDFGEHEQQAPGMVAEGGVKYGKE